MRKHVSTKKALLSSVISLMLCIALLLGATMAWFTDSASNTGNRIESGNLDVDLLMDKQDGNGYISIADGEGDIFSESVGNGVLWEPGKTYIVYLQVKNKGNLALKYNININVSDTDTTDIYNLANVLEYAVIDDAKPGDIQVNDWAALVATGVHHGSVPNGAMTADANGQLFAEEGKDADYFALAVHMKEDAGNEYQGMAICIDIQVVAGQLVYESDSFGSNYDESASYVSDSGHKSGMAELVSTLHRNVPTEFTTSNDLNDILYFDNATPEEQKKMYENIKNLGTVVCDSDEFLDGILWDGKGDDYGNHEVVEVEGPAFDKVLRINCTQVPPIRDSDGVINTAKYVVKTTATPEVVTGQGLTKNDVMLIAFWARSTDNGGDDKNQVTIQVEQSDTPYAKDVYTTYTVEDEWNLFFIPYKVTQTNPTATGLGVRACWSLGTVEIGGFEILNFGQNMDMNLLPVTSASEYPELEPDAEWRRKANERIEEIRKGDFSVIVKDKDGNVIPNAEVEFDMFEHEFQFGTAVAYQVTNNETYTQNMESLFNSAVIEHQMKWAPYEENSAAARLQFNGAVNAGAKYMRGHTLFWQREFSSDGVTNLTPSYMFTQDILSDKDAFLQKCWEHILDICGEFKGEIADWDVVNELVKYEAHGNVFGREIYKQWFDMARQVAGEDCDLYYNEGLYFGQYHDTFIERVEDLVEMGTDFDGIGLQSHYEESELFKMPTEIIDLYEELDKYGKRLKVTEYSYSVADQNLQANYTRDILIASFAEEDMDGFLFWGFWDGKNYAAYSPFYSVDWELKPAGQQYIDLVYNKWWTQDAKATTDSFGKATIRGFYGDYDVTVTVSGVTKTVSCAYHKGYENVLEIVLD